MLKEHKIVILYFVKSITLFDCNFVSLKCSYSSVNISNLGNEGIPCRAKRAEVLAPYIKCT